MGEREVNNLETEDYEVHAPLRQETLVSYVELLLSRKVPDRYQVLHTSWEVMLERTDFSEYKLENAPCEFGKLAYVRL